MIKFDSSIILFFFVFIITLFSCQLNQPVTINCQNTYAMKEYFPLEDIQWVTFFDKISEDTVQWTKVDTISLNYTLFQHMQKSPYELLDTGWSNTESGLFIHCTQGRYRFEPPIQIAPALVNEQSEINRNHIRYDDLNQSIKVYHTTSKFIGHENLETNSGLIQKCLKFQLDFFPWDNPHACNSYIYWFARGLGLVKKDLKFQTLELKHIAINGEIIPKPRVQQPYRYIKYTAKPTILVARN